MTLSIQVFSSLKLSVIADGYADARPLSDLLNSEQRSEPGPVHGDTAGEDLPPRTGLMLLRTASLVQCNADESG